jgi:heat shock protein HslJ
MKPGKSILMTFVAAALLFVAACSPQAEAGPINETGPLGDGTAPSVLPPATDELANTQWQLESFGAVGSETAVLPDTALTLSFDAMGGAGGDGGCNSFGGKYKTQGTKVSFTDVAQTLRACVDDSANQQEAQYVGALESTGAYELNGDTLTIFYDGGSSALHFVKA